MGAEFEQDTAEKIHGKPRAKKTSELSEAEKTSEQSCEQNEAENLCDGPLYPGRMVMITGLTANPWLNGLLGELVDFHELRGRYVVRVFRLDIDGIKDMLIKEDNLRIMTDSELEALKCSV